MSSVRALLPVPLTLFALAHACGSDEAENSDGASGSAGKASGGNAGAARGGGAALGGAGPAAGATMGGALSAGGRANPAAGTAGAGGAPATGGRNAGGAAATGGIDAAGAPFGGETGGAGAPGSAGKGGGVGAGGAAEGGSGGEPSVGQGGTGSGVDPFGITQLYPSANASAVWTSEHWTGTAYEIDARTDENDPLEISGMRGEGTLEVTGTGELVMSGSQPRIYVYPGANGPWKNVEVTVYYQRVEDEGTAYAGLVVGARSGADGHTDSSACDAHTYYARLRNDGAIDFEKELEHPASSTQSRVNPQTVWPPDGEVPRDSWIGWKFVIYNLPSGDAVKLEAYRDLTNGEDGGDWLKMNETTDDGGWSVETDCDEYQPSGGESDAVVLDGGVTFIRNTDVGEARYRWFSVREISVP